MFNAIVLAAVMGAAPFSPPVLLSVAAPAVQPPALDWSLEGRVGVNEDGEFSAGLTYVPDVEFPLGIWVQAERVEWENSFHYVDVHFSRSHPPVLRQVHWTEDDSDVKWSAGVSWRFR